MIPIGRRDVIAGIGGAAAWPLTARGQQPTLPVVGVVHPASARANPGYVSGFRKGLGESGYVEGRNVTVEYHWLEGQYDHLPALMADLVRRRVAVIVAFGLTWRAAKDATATIPIVFFVGYDPVKMGLVASLARPGGNATGVTFFGGELLGKRLQLLHDLLPKAVRVAVLFDSNDLPAEVQEAQRSELAEVQEAARSLGLQIQICNASTIGEIDAVFAALARDRPDALFVHGPSIFFSLHRAQLLTLAASHRIPASYDWFPFVREGGLMSYETDYPETFRQVGNYAGRILRGEKSGDLPVLQSTKFEFALNLQTAQALGIEVPSGVLSIVDEVIE